MSKLSADRKWWLRQWEWGGWHTGNPMKCHLKKWRAHTDALTAAGLLERDSTYPLEEWQSPMCRMTDKGREALREQS